MVRSVRSVRDAVRVGEQRREQRGRLPVEALLQLLFQQQQRALFEAMSAGALPRLGGRASHPLHHASQGMCAFV